MAETVGSSFCRGFGVCQHSNMQIILVLQVSHFVEKNGGTLVSDLLAQRPLLSEMWNRSFPLQNGLLYISGFSGETKVLSRHITPLQKWNFVFLRACFVAGSHSAYVCSCQVPHFLEASGSYNPKSAPKKSGLGALIL